MATIKDVAQEAGLAVSTVSRILNNRGYISESARQKVEEAMEKLNYQPNELARSLHRKNSNVIGLIVPTIDQPYFAKVIHHLEEEAYKKDFRILICNTQTKKKREQASIDVCRQNRVAGIIMCTGQLSVKGFEDLGVPVVGWERFIDISSPVIECDNVQGGMLAAQHLIDKGCRHLLHLGMATNLKMPGDYRFVGFRTVCEQNQIEYMDKIPEYVDGFYADYTEEIKAVLEDNPQIDGIFANNDILASQAIRACSQMGLQIPEQIKIVGYDDIFFSNCMNPSLTTIHQPVKEMAVHAMDVLASMINGKTVASRVIFPVHLVERESTK